MQSIWPGRFCDHWCVMCSFRKKATFNLRTVSSDALSIVWCHCDEAKLNFPNSFVLSNSPPSTRDQPSPFRIEAEVFLTLCTRRIYVNDPWIWKINLIYSSPFARSISKGKKGSRNSRVAFPTSIDNRDDFRSRSLLLLRLALIKVHFPQQIIVVFASRFMINQHNLNSSRSPFKSRTEKWSGIKYNRRANCFKIICFSILIYANSLPLNSSLIEREKLLSLAGNIACDKTHQKKEPEKVILIFSFWMNHNELKKAPTLITNFFFFCFRGSSKQTKPTPLHETQIKQDFFCSLPPLELEGERNCRSYNVSVLSSFNWIIFEFFFLVFSVLLPPLTIKGCPQLWN